MKQRLLFLSLEKRADQASESISLYSKLCVCLLTCAILLVAGQSRAAVSYIYVNPTSSVHGLDPQQYIESTTGSVSFSGSGTEASAYAGTGELKVKTGVAQSVGGFYNKNARTQVGFVNNINVDSGSSGLSAGTPITLRVSLSLHGTLDTMVWHSGSGGDEGGNATADAQLRESSFFTIRDKTPSTGEGGSSSTIAVDFQPDAHLRLNGSWNVDTGWEYVFNQDWGWTLTNNLGDNQSDGVTQPMEIYNCDSFSSLCPSTRALNFDTGTLVIDFETSVGNTLAISGLLESWSDGINGGSDAVVLSANSDFYNTFNVNILDAYGTGVDLVYELAPPVPVPPAVWLFGSGLIGLIGIARRKKS